MSRTRARLRILATTTSAMLLVPVGAIALGAVRASGPLVDLATSDATLDGATARVQVVPTGDGGTIATLSVSGIDRSLAGRTLGAHVHTGGCNAGPGGTGGHYSTGGAPAADTEVWLDIEVQASGTAHSVADVPFQIPTGAAGSVVIHADPTAPNGTAGTKLACLPVDL